MGSSFELLSLAGSNWIASVASLAAIVSATDARAFAAAPLDEEDNTPTRSGPTASLGFGGVVTGAEGTGVGLGTIAFLDVGWFVGRRLAIVLGVTGVARPQSKSASTKQSLWHLAAEYWFTRKYHGRIGIGSSHLGRFEDNADYGSSLGVGFGATVGVGREVWSWRALALNVELFAAGALNGDDPSSYAAYGGAGLELAWQ